VFRRLNRFAAVATIILGAFGLAALTAESAAVAAETPPADAGGADFLTVTSAPIGGFENLAPGDTVAWLVTARNGAAVDAEVSLRVQSDSTSPLLTDAAHGLRMQLTACDTNWDGADPSPHCPGTATPIAHGPLALLLGGYRLPALAADSSAHYLAQVTLPAEATNELAGQTADLRFEITAGQEPRGNAPDPEVPAPASPGERTPQVPTSESALTAEPVSRAAEPTPRPTVAAVELASSGVAGASVAKSLGLALLAAGSLILVLRRIRAL